jgi:hypothetical protein
MKKGAEIPFQSATSPPARKFLGGFGDRTGA